MPPLRRDRAQVVCVSCHARKVRCNLQESPNRKCQNCRRHNVDCVVRTGPRSGPLAGALQSSATRARVQQIGAESNLATNVQSAARSDETGDGSPPAASQNNKTRLLSSVGDHSLLAHDALKGVEVKTGPLALFTPEISPVLRFAEATALPKAAMQAALTESYFQHVFPRYPVVDRTELADAGCSLLMKQAVCMAGSLMRHSSSADGLALSLSLYEKTKLMLFLNFEPDPVTNLAVLCLMIGWNPHPTNVPSLDCPWQWAGTAIRLALQLGMHKEATYVNRSDASRLRRIWWILVNADRQQTACFGRPPALRWSDCDTKRPSLADFEQENISSHIFVHYAHVIAIWGEIADLGMRGGPVTPAGIKKLTDFLCTWVSGLPEEIRLFDPTGSRCAYSQSVSELHMVYFVTIILLEALSIKRHEWWSASIPAIVAGSAIARLIEEVDCRDDLSSMSAATTFYMLAAGIPLIYHHTDNAETRHNRQEDLQTLHSALEQMSSKWGGAVVVGENIKRIRHLVERQSAEPMHDVLEQETSYIPPPQRYRLKEMFPFPDTLSPSMALLNEGVDDVVDFTHLMLPQGDGAFSWANNDGRFFSPFQLDMYGDPFDLGDEASGLLNSTAYDFSSI